MVGVVDLVGGQVALELFQKTQKIESEGGMMIKNGERRRTPGGVFLHLLREMTDDPRVDPKKVKQFFAQSQKIEFHREHKSFQHTDGKQHKDANYILAILDSRKKFVAHERFQYVLLKKFGETDQQVNMFLFSYDNIFRVQHLLFIVKIKNLMRILWD